jgi:cytidylate kinase
MRLAQIGNVILVGRGANIVTKELENVFHVHLVGTLEKRIKRAQEVFNLDEKAATKYIKQKDKSRRRYIKDNFDQDMDNPLLYHVVINTDLVQYNEAARMIGNEIIAHFKLDKIPKLQKVGTI